MVSISISIFINCIESRVNSCFTLARYKIFVRLSRFSPLIVRHFLAMREYLPHNVYTEKLKPFYSINIVSSLVPGLHTMDKKVLNHLINVSAERFKPFYSINRESSGTRVVPGLHTKQESVLSNHLINVSTEKFHDGDHPLSFFSLLQCLSI